LKTPEKDDIATKENVKPDAKNDIATVKHVELEEKNDITTKHKTQYYSSEELSDKIKEFFFCNVFLECKAIEDQCLTVKLNKKIDKLSSDAADLRHIKIRIIAFSIDISINQELNKEDLRSVVQPSERQNYFNRHNLSKKASDAFYKIKDDGRDVAHTYTSTSKENYDLAKYLFRFSENSPLERNHKEGTAELFLHFCGKSYNDIIVAYETENKILQVFCEILLNLSVIKFKLFNIKIK
jgi:hypothetical protein